MQLPVRNFCILERITRVLTFPINREHLSPFIKDMASMLHRMMLIGHARSSHFIERHNIGITKLNTAISAPNVVLKPSENQETANVIHLTSSNFVKIYHRNYLHRVNSWKHLWKFLNDPLCRNKSGLSPLRIVATYWKSSKTKAWVKRISQILSNNSDNVGRGGVNLRIYVNYCLRKQVKNKRGLEKRDIFFFLLLLTLLNIWSMSNGFLTNYIPAWQLWPRKNWSVKFNEKWNELWLSNDNFLSIQAVLLLFTSYTAQTQIIFSIYLLNTLSKFSEESSVQMSFLNVPFAVFKTILNIYGIRYIYNTFSTFLSVYQDS